MMGLGILNFQNKIIASAGQDGWFSIIVGGAAVHLVIWMIFTMLNNPAKDFIQLHASLFGKVLGGFLSLALAGFFIVYALTIWRTFIEILQVWVFPTIHTWEFAFVMACLTYYLVSGGFRVIVGFCLVNLVICIVLSVLFTFFVQYGKLYNLLPVFNHSPNEMLSSFKSAGEIFVGITTIMIYFPFLKSGRKNGKWAHAGLISATAQYTLLMVITILYFSQGQLKHTIWATLEMTKIFRFAFITRLEIIVILLMFIGMVPSGCIPLWCSTRILKSLTPLKPRLSLAVILIGMFAASVWIKEHTAVVALSRFLSNVGFYIVFVYIPVIFIAYLVKKAFQRNPISPETSEGT